MGDIEIGKCEVCGKDDVQLLRDYYSFPHIKCSCHNLHSIVVRHCRDCKPVWPQETTVVLPTHVLAAIDKLIASHPHEYTTNASLIRRANEKRPGGAANACEAMYMSD